MHISRKNLAFLPAFLLVLRLADAQCDLPPNGITAWWPGEGNGDDVVGTNNGTPINGTYFAAGEVGQCFGFDGISAAVFVPGSARLNIGTNAGMSIECWINPSDNAEHALAEWNSGSANGTHLWISASAPAGDYSPGALYANLVDTTGARHNLSSGPGIIVTNSFQHVALTYSTTSGTATLYVNGAVVASQNLGSFIPETSYNFYIGNRPFGGLAGSFNGLIDEIAVYNRALSPAEIYSIWAAGNSGKCHIPIITAAPQSQIGYWGQSATFSVAAYLPPLNYQWLSNGVPIAGATNQTLVLTNLQNSFAAGYTVVVSNSYGSVTSSPPANLTVNPAGVGIALYSGVQISGTVGLTYGIQYSTNLTDLNDWIGLTNLTLIQPTEVWYDSIPAVLSQRYYRVLEGPVPIP